MAVDGSGFSSDLWNIRTYGWIWSKIHHSLSFNFPLPCHGKVSAMSHLRWLIVPCLRLPAAFPRERCCHSCCSLRNAVGKRGLLLWWNIFQWIETARLSFIHGLPGYLHTWNGSNSGTTKLKVCEAILLRVLPHQTTPCLCCMRPVLSIGSGKGIWSTQFCCLGIVIL